MKTYLFGFLALVVLFLGNEAGIYWSLYTTWAGYDIFMHILGGFGIGMSLAAAVELHGRLIAHKRIVIVIGVIVAGILWELFEAYYNIAGAPVGTKAYYIDTVKDLIDDTLGGVIAFTLEFGSRD